MEDWEKTFNVIKYNPIAFLEHYYNIVDSENKVELTLEQKQHFFDKYKNNAIPFYDDFGKGEELFRQKADLQAKMKAEKKQDWENYNKL